MKFKIFSRLTLLGRRWYFHGRSSRNGKIMLASEGYRNHADCLETVQAIRAEAATAPIDDLEWTKGQTNRGTDGP